MPYDDNEITDADPGLTEADLDEVEAEIGESLPQSLREHYAEFNGGQLQNYAFTAPDGQTVEVHELLAMRPTGSGDFEDAFKQARVDPGTLPGDYVPFAIDPGGALFCIGDTTDTSGHVFYFNPDDADEGEDAMIYLAPSLRDFIEGMV